MSTFGLNEQHEASVVNYMRFARYQKSIKLKSIIRSFQDISAARLTDDTYTREEVKAIIGDLMDIVKTDVDQELTNTSHMNSLLLVQLFQQAEKWHLTLNADTSEMENRELLEQMRDFEKNEFNSSKELDHKPTFKLEPLPEGSSALLNMEIERLNNEKAKMSEKFKTIEAEAISLQKEKLALKQSFDEMQKELIQLKQNSNNHKNDSSNEVRELQMQLKQLKTTIDDKSSKANMAELTEAKHELLKVKELLELAEKELEKKVQQTVPFQNLKQMVQKKTDQIKDLRSRLLKYEKEE